MIVHHYEGGFVEILEVTLAGTGNLSGFEDSHEVVQGFKNE